MALRLLPNRLGEERPAPELTTISWVDWPIGGTVQIGAPDYNTYILMQAINENKSRIKITAGSILVETPARQIRAGTPTAKPLTMSSRTHPT